MDLIILCIPWVWNGASGATHGKRAPIASNAAGTSGTPAVAASASCATYEDRVAYAAFVYRNSHVAYASHVTRTLYASTASRAEEGTWI